jgi:hypothetical protein
MSAKSLGYLRYKRREPSNELCAHPRELGQDLRLELGSGSKAHCPK